MSGLPLVSTAFAYKRIAGADPAANAEISDTVPAGANEVQTISGTASGTFGLQLGSESGPATLGVAATAADVQAYIRTYLGLGADAVSCSGGPLATAVTVTFDGARTKAQNWPQLAVTGATTGLSFNTTTQGSSPKAWWLLGVSVQLVQGATQTPFPSLVIDDGANIVFQAFAGTAALNASVTAQVSWAPDVPASGSGASTVLTGPLHGLAMLLPGWRVRTVTTGIGANTNYGAPSYYVCELTL